jgi:hypothetical protein
MPITVDIRGDDEYNKFELPYGIVRISVNYNDEATTEMTFTVHGINVENLELFICALKNNTRYNLIMSDAFVMIGTCDGSTHITFGDSCRDDLIKSSSLVIKNSCCVAGFENLLSLIKQSVERSAE